MGLERAHSCGMTRGQSLGSCQAIRPCWSLSPAESALSDEVIWSCRDLQRGPGAKAGISRLQAFHGDDPSLHMRGCNMTQGTMLGGLPCWGCPRGGETATDGTHG